MTDKISLKQANQFLLCAVLICLVLHFGKEVLIPVTFAVFFAMLFTPLSNRLEGWGIKRGFTAFISVLILVMATVGIGMLVYMQSKKLAERSEDIEKKSEQFMQKAQSYITSKLSVTQKKQDEMISKQLKSFMQSSGRLFKDFVTGFAGIVATFVIVLIFTFLFLLQRDKYEAFFIKISGTGQNPDETKRVIGQVSKVAQSYLTGRVISILIFTTLFTCGFLIISLESAFLLAFIAALLTIVPYVGSIVGGLFPFAVALVTADMNVALGALVVILVVQTLDNYFIEPYIIGGEVNISGFFTILILLVGGVMWGVAGMVLFLPMLAVTKIVFDAIPKLKPYAFLIGDQETEKPSKRLLEKIKKLFKKK